LGLNRKLLYDEKLTFDYSIMNQIASVCKRPTPKDEENIQFTLANLYQAYFDVPQLPHPINMKLTRDVTDILEEYLSESIIEPIASKIKADEVPTDPRKYVKWYVAMIHEYPGVHHPFYANFFRHYATREDLRFWLAQESVLDPKFADIIALLQVGSDTRMKMELAKNYWDEMGNGKSTKTHTKLFDNLITELSVTPEYIQNNILLLSLMSGNVSSFYSIHRRNYYRALGYFGVMEYLAPYRFKDVIAAMKRCGLSAQGMEYHDLHIQIDSIHGNGWINNVIKPIVRELPEAAVEISRGAMVRLETSTLHLDSLLEHVKVARNG